MSSREIGSERRRLDALVQRGISALPLVALLGGFAISRVLTYAAGVRYDATALSNMWQLIEPQLLRERLLESVFYFHAQPPLFSLLVGLHLKVFGGWADGALNVTWVSIGMFQAIVVYLLLVRLSVDRWASAAVSLVLAVSPAALLYENWLFYEYPLMLILSSAGLALYLFLDRPTILRGSAFFSLLAAAILMRTLYQLVWFLLALALVLAFSRHRRVVLQAAAIPLLVVSLVYAKNIVLFGVPSTGSFFGSHLSNVVIKPLSEEQRRGLVADGTISEVAALPAFTPPEMLRGRIPWPEQRGIPVLDRPRKRNGEVNYNHLVYVELSKRHFRASLATLAVYPDVYLRTVAEGTWLSFLPAAEFPYVEANRPYLSRWERLYNGLVYGRVRRVTTRGLFIVVAYVFAIAYGVLAVWRLARNKAESRTDALVVAFLGVTILYAFLVGNFTEITENQRVRYPTEPLVGVVVTAAIAGAWRRRKHPLDRQSA